MIDVPLDGSFDAFRQAVRPLLAHRVPPDRVRFVQPGDPPSLFGGEVPPTGGPPPVLPRRFLGLARRALCYDAPDRAERVYRVAFRLLDDRSLLDDPGDDDVLALTRRSKHVARDIHKMHAFVRLRRQVDDEGEHWVAFHRPDHHVVRLAAPHFADRFGDSRFALLTPKGTALHVPGQGLTFGPAAADPGLDEGQWEGLWSTYYASIFNPARPMVGAMLAEMPKKHWATMPETRQIPRLLREAPRRVQEAAARGEGRVVLPAPLTLPALADTVRRCTACPLGCSGRPGVPGEGPRHAPMALVGEQPGDQEDRAGRPFVGPAGQLLDAALTALGQPRGELYLTNTVKHFRYRQQGPKRIHESPDRYHVERCKPILDAELDHVQPRVIVALGLTAARGLLGKAVRHADVAGRVLRSRHGPLVVAPHPSALLRRGLTEPTELLAPLALALSTAAGSVGREAVG